MRGKGINIDDPGIREAAFTTTYLISCIPHPECGRALEIFLLYRERTEYDEKREDLQNEFNQLIGPVYEARDNGTIAELYKKYNSEEQ